MEVDWISTQKSILTGVSDFYIGSNNVHIEYLHSFPWLVNGTGYDLRTDHAMIHYHLELPIHLFVGKKVQHFLKEVRLQTPC